MKLRELKRFLKEASIKLQKSKGQNFLIEQNVLRLMLSQMKPQEGEFILEIGPGLGVLSKSLLEARVFLCAIEIDPILFAHLKKSLAYKNLNLILGDACKQDYKRILPQSFRCLANLPYNISGPFLAQMLILGFIPQEMFFLLQKEMVDRLIASHSTKNYSALSVMSQALYSIKIIRSIKPSAFYPIPKVDSYFVSFKKKQENHFPNGVVRGKFLSFLRQAFQKRRKTMSNNFSNDLKRRNLISSYLEEKNFSLMTRAEELGIDDFIDLFHFMRNKAQ